MSKINFDIEKINSDPESYAKNQNISTVMSFLRYANESYHDDMQEEIIDDDTYDIIYDIAKKRVPTNPFFKEIGIGNNELKSLVKLPNYMSSMDKFKINQNKDDTKIIKSLNTWLVKMNKLSTELCISDKLDGLSGLLVYQSKEDNEIDNKINLYTRGNDKGGKDVSHLIPYLNLPIHKDIINNKIKKLTVRGEFIISKSKFDSKYKNKYPKARSLISGAITAKPDSRTFKEDIVNRLKDIVFITYEIVDIKLNELNNSEAKLKLSEQLRFLKKLNFEVVWHQIVKTLSLVSNNASELSKILGERKINSGYEIDGIILHTESKYERVKKGNPNYAVAFKINYSKMAVLTTVKNVEWNPSKHGKLTPRVVVEQVIVGGDKVSYVTGHNAKYILNNNIGPGTKIKLIKSGDVIPYILEVVKPTKAQLPDKDITQWKWNNTKIDIILEEKESNRDVNIRRIHHFITTLDIPFINTGIITKLYDSGFTTIKDIMNISVKDLLMVDGIKETSAKKYHKAIHSIIDNPIKIEVLMTASNSFGKGFGVKKIKPLTNKYSSPSIVELYVAGKLTKDMILEVEGYSVKSAESFIKGLPKFIKFMKNNSYLKLKKEGKKKSRSKDDNDTSSNKLNKVKKIKKNVIENKKFVFTGFRNKDLEEAIEGLGGKISSSISGNTDYLVIKDENTTGTKLDKAKKLNVKIIKLDDLMKMI